MNRKNLLITVTLVIGGVLTVLGTKTAMIPICPGLGCFDMTYEVSPIGFAGILLLSVSLVVICKRWIQKDGLRAATLIAFIAALVTLVLLVLPWVLPPGVVAPARPHAHFER